MEAKEHGTYVMSVDDLSPTAQAHPTVAIFTEPPPTTTSISGPSFLRRQKENAAHCFPGLSQIEAPLQWTAVSALAWLLLRDVCDWFDADFTQDGEEASSPKRSISIRLLLLFVPPLAVVDLVINFLLSVFILPLVMLKCCYPFKAKLIEARKAGSPHSCPSRVEICLRLW